MAHELEIIENKAQMAYVGATPWHGLGVSLEEGVMPMEMMEAAGLDWKVEKRDLAVTAADGTKIIVPNKKALMRENDNKILDIVGEDWQPVQNATAFSFFEEFCKEGSIKMHTAGSLFDGKKIWALGKIESNFTLFDGDKVEGYLLFSNPHQFGSAVDVRFTPIRVVCNNTLTLSLGSEAQNFARISHRKEFDPEMVKQVLGIAKEKMHEYKIIAETLGAKQVTDKQFRNFLGKIFGESKKEDKETGMQSLTRTAQLAYDSFETQPGAEFARGSWWQALNAVTYVTDHKIGNSTQTRLNSMWYGANRSKKINAVKTAMEMANA
jgi:phage/plasmid-like protein (TIGR03299 family)|tara:strand:- start:18772 stop:19740 length:969 start_codon:yes stop_codon:yes gene_type:complete